jgi:hypothetical protein
VAKTQSVAVTGLANASKPPLVERGQRTHASAMFVVTEEEAAALTAAAGSPC